MLIRRATFAAFAVTAALSVGAPAAGASALPTWAFPTLSHGTRVAGLGIPYPGASAAVPTGACNSATVDGQGRTGGTQTHVCTGAGLTFIGPSVGQMASVIGPTIISPVVNIGASVQSAGNVVIAP
jgi:hypothetical protein